MPEEPGYIKEERGYIKEESTYLRSGHYILPATLGPLFSGIYDRQNWTHIVIL